MVVAVAHGITCACVNCCNRFEAQGMHWDNTKRRYVKPKSSNNWSPRTVGTLDDDVVTFREGQGDKQGQTLIADGEKSSRDFNRNHNHYGPASEGGRIEDVGGDRGKYTGSGH